MIESTEKTKKPRGSNASIMVWDNDPRDIKPVGHVMTLTDMEEKQVLACDILNMYQHPIGNVAPTLKDSDYDSCRGILFFIPGRESNYVKVSE